MSYRYYDTPGAIGKLLESLLFLVDAVVFVGSVFLLADPGVILKVVDSNDILTIVLVVFLVSMVGGTVMLYKWSSRLFTVMSMTFSLTALIAAIVGLSVCHLQTYRIYEAEDFKILANLPSNDEYAYNVTIERDIDFAGVDFEDTFGEDQTFGNYETAYNIDGKGHVVKNIKYETEINVQVRTLFRMLCNDSEGALTSKVENIRFISCEFYIAPNLSGSYSGNKAYFSLFGNYDFKYPTIKNVSVTSTVAYVYDSPDESKSFGGIIPAGGSGLSENYVVDIRIEEAGEAP